MKLPLFLLLSLLFGTAAAFAGPADSVIITGYLKGNTKYARAMLYRFDVGEIPVANTEITGERLRLALPKALPQGVYRLRYSAEEHDRYIDLVLAGEPLVAFEMTTYKEGAAPVFITSEQNRTWYRYRAYADSQSRKMALLGSFIGSYPVSDASVVYQARQSWVLEKTAFEAAFKRFVVTYRDSWAGKLVASRPPWFPNPKDDPKLQSYYWHEQYWNGVSTADTNLLNSPVYTDLVLDYLRYYMDPQMQFSEQQMTEGFVKSVDTIMTRFSRPEPMRRFALAYLTKGFKEIGQEQVLQYLDERYAIKEQCSNEQPDKELEQRLTAYRAMKPGQAAPEIRFSGPRQLQMGLKDIGADTVVVAFWASWCPHCVQAMPKLNSTIAAHPGIRVLAVSLDEDSAAYDQAKAPLGNMLHYCDYRKWNSRPVADYHIMATPTFFVLDRERRIIDKAASLEALLRIISSGPKI